MVRRVLYCWFAMSAMALSTSAQDTRTPGRTATSELERYRALATKATSLRGTIGNLEAQAGKLRTQITDLKSRLAKAITDLRHRKTKELLAMKLRQSEENRKRIAKKKNIMDEYRRGVFCKGCGMTRIEFNNSWKAKRESWEKHTKRNKLTGATPEMIRKKSAELEEPIRAAWKQHDAGMRRRAKAWDRKVSSARADFEKRVHAVNAQITKARRAQDRARSTIRNAQHEASRVERRYHNAARRDHVYLQSQRAKYDAVAQSLDYHESDLKQEYLKAKATYDQSEAEHSKKWPMKPQDTPPEKLSERKEDGDRLRAMRLGLRAKLKRVDQVRSKKTANTNAKARVEQEFRTRRLGEHKSLETAKRTLYNSPHHSLSSIDWMFDESRLRDPAVRKTTPPVSISISRELEKAASDSVEKPRKKENADPFQLPYKLKTNWDKIEDLALESIMKARRVIPHREIRKWAANKTFYKETIKNGVREGMSYLLRGRSWRELPELMQKEAELWTAATYETIINPIVGGFTKVKRYGEFMDLIWDGIWNDKSVFDEEEK